MPDKSSARNLLESAWREDGHTLSRAELAVLASIERMERERELFIYWLLQAYGTINRQPWENEHFTDRELGDALCSLLANHGYDPNLSEKAKELIKRKPVYFVAQT